ncbi:MAG: glycosyltransferase, partial [Ilumatobacter sp.]
MAINFAPSIADGVPSTSDLACPRPGELDRSKRPDEPKVSVIVPTLNEARNLPYALWRLPKCVVEVVVVDG